MVDMNAVRSYVPRWAGVVELNLADQWRAKWVNEQELPTNAPVNYAYAMVCLDNYGYAFRAEGTEKWGMIEGATGDEKPEAFIKAFATKNGITTARIDLVGFLECKATRHNKEYEMGDITVRPLHVVTAKKASSTPPKDTGFERRRFPLNQYAVALRARYPELDDYIGKASLRYEIIRTKG